MERYKLTIQECSSGYEGHNHLEKIIDLGFEGKLRIARRGGKEGDDQMVEIERWRKSPHFMLIPIRNRNSFP